MKLPQVPKKLVKITPKSSDATKDFFVDEMRIGSVSAQGLADYSPDTAGYIPRHANAEAMLRRFKETKRA